MHTYAEIAISDDGKTAALIQNGKTLTATIASSTNPDLKFKVAQTTQTEIENPNKGVSVLAIDVPASDEEQSLEVEFK